jgi:hypothetical protein
MRDRSWYLPNRDARWATEAYGFRKVLSIVTGVPTGATPPLSFARNVCLRFGLNIPAFA